MAETKTQTAAAPKELTAADAAKLVKRQVPVLEKGKPKTNAQGEPVFRAVPVKADEVLSFKDYGTHVMVVTTDGRKLRGAK